MAKHNKGICKRGHRLEGENLVIVSGTKICRECRNMRARNQYWGLPTNPPVIIDGKRECTHCHQKKPLLEFYMRGGGCKGDSRKTESVCKVCKYQKDRARLEKESVKVRRAMLLRQRRQRDPLSHARKAKEHRVKLRNEVLAAYGNACECCGENQKEFLAIDHRNGGGSQARKQGIHIAGTQFYLWLKKLDFPKDEFRLLCHNCNMARGCYGFCPHEKIVTSLIESVSRKETQPLPNGEIFQ